MCLSVAVWQVRRVVTPGLGRVRKTLAHLTPPPDLIEISIVQLPDTDTTELHSLGSGLKYGVGRELKTKQECF